MKFRKHKNNSSAFSTYNVMIEFADDTNIKKTLKKREMNLDPVLLDFIYWHGKIVAKSALG